MPDQTTDTSSGSTFQRTLLRVMGVQLIALVLLALLQLRYS